MIVDPEAVKNICNASVDSKGFCFYKATNRIKRHKAMDSLGFPFFLPIVQKDLSLNYRELTMNTTPKR